jgi:hypothetical protein
MKNTMMLILISSFVIAFGFSYAWAQAPGISFIPPSTENGTEAVNKTYIVWNISSNEDMAACKIEINSTNQTGTIVNATTDSYCYYNETGLSGNITRCSVAHAANGSGVWNTTLVMVCRNTNEQQSVDNDPPSLDFVPPTPANNTYTRNKSWVFINISGSEQLSACLLDNGTSNTTMTLNYDCCHHNITGKANNTEVYVWVWANDTSDNMNRSSELNITINLTSATVQDTTLPVIENYEISPSPVPFGQPVHIGINASDDKAIDKVWANITDPSGEHNHTELVNNYLVRWDTNVIGMYNITMFANDTSSNTVNLTDSFYVGELVEVNITVLDIDDEGLSTDLEIYVACTGQRVFWDHESDGEFDADLVEHDYDMLFKVFDDELELLFRGVPLTSDFNGNLSLDYTSTTDFEYIFAVETDYQIEDALVTIYYDGMGFDNETNVHAYLCDDWDFDYQECNEDWEKIENATNDEDDESLEFNVEGFSAFVVREDSYCGDDWCGPGETVSSCPDDCQCDEGDTRACSLIHDGICAVGNETCSGNKWSGCPQPISESCNLEDDNCNGKIDDVDGGASVAATRCQCYNGGKPQAETCNGIDDNCDGIIDNGADCCTSGQSRECGPATDEGECKFGTSKCSSGVWGACIGAVYPEDEICGDLKDNDCDGETDETCQVPSCGEGQINQSCICEGSVRTSGYCCSGLYSEEKCAETLWWILTVTGVAILVVLAALVLYFKSKGKELTWEELMKKYTPARIR